MTNDVMSLRALVEKTPDTDILREMIGLAATPGDPHQKTSRPTTQMSCLGLNRAGEGAAAAEEKEQKETPVVRPSPARQRHRVGG